MSRTKKTANKKSRKKSTGRSLPTRSSSKKKNKKQSSTNKPINDDAVIATLTKEDKGARDMILEPILERLLEEKNNAKLKQGRPLYGKIKETVEKYNSLLPWLTPNILTMRLKRRRAKLKKSNNVMAVLTLPTPIPDHPLAQPHTSNSDDVHSISTITITTDDPTIVSISSCSNTSSTSHDTTFTRKRVG